MRDGVLPFRVLGQVRVIAIEDLDQYLDSLPKQTGKLREPVAATQARREAAWNVLHKFTHAAAHVRRERRQTHMNMTKEIKKLKVQERSYFVACKEFKRAARNLLNKAQKHLAPHVSVTKPTEAALDIVLDDFMSSNTRVV
jgi:hypothetical protein